MNETTAPPSVVPRHQGRSMRLLTRIEARERLGNISDDKFYGLIRAGDINPPLKIGVASRWLESDIEDYIHKLTEARQAPSTPAGIRRHHAKLAAKDQRGLRQHAESQHDAKSEVVP